MDKKMKCRVSVIIPCYNLGKYIEEAVNSVLDQTVKDFEIVIVDDGSTDDFTRELLANYRRPKTRVLRTENKGLCAARNLGIRESQGDYLCCLDADDFLEPSHLAKCSAVLDKRADVGLVTFWYKLFGEEEGEVKPSGVEMKDFLVQNSACVASLFRREAWKRVGGYDNSFKGYADWDFWISILESGYKAFLIEQFLMRYRVRSDSMVHTSDRPEVREKIMQGLFTKHEAGYRANAIAVLREKERLIGEYRYYWKCEEAEAKRLKKYHSEAHKYIEELKAERDKLNDHHLEAHRYIDELKTDQEKLNKRYAELKAERDEYMRLLAERECVIKNISQDLQQKQGIILAREDELRSLYASKVWQLWVLFKEARHSLKAFLLLPFRIILLGCSWRGRKK